MTDAIPELQAQVHFHKFEEIQGGPLQSQEQRNRIPSIYKRQPVKVYDAQKNRYEYLETTPFGENHDKTPRYECDDSHSIETQSLGEVEFAYATNRGKKREHKPNEDRVRYKLVSSQDGKRQFLLFTVDDGIGGNSNGFVASTIAAETIINTVEGNISKTNYFEDDTFTNALKNGVTTANLEILRLNSEWKTNMGTTTVSGIINLSTYKFYLANVGDSRGYKQDEKGDLKKITTDHSVVAGLVEAGIIKPDAIYTHPKRNQIYRSLGEKPTIDVDTFSGELQPGQTVLLCSDGLWEMVKDPVIAKVLANSADANQRARDLVQTALDERGEDNVTVFVLQRKNNAVEEQEVIRPIDIQPGDEIPVPANSKYKRARYVGKDPQTNQYVISWVEKGQEKKGYTLQELYEMNQTTVLCFGDEIQVQRDGSLEPGWIIFGKENGLFTLRKYQIDRANYSQQDMQTIISGKPATSLLNARTKDELKSILMEMGGFFYNNRAYSAREAIALVENLSAGYQDTLEHLPKEIADKVIDVVKNEIVNENFAHTMFIAHAPVSPDLRSEIHTREEYEQVINSGKRFLYALDRRVQGIIIDNRGKITIVDSQIPVDLDLLTYEQAYLDLIGRYKIINDSAIEKIKRDFPGEVIDTTVYMGAVIVTYDSSKVTPSNGRLNSNYDFYDAATGILGSCKQFGDNTLGFIPVDINPKKHRNNSPTNTARHELNHHAHNVTNFMLSTYSKPAIESAYWHRFPSVFKKLGILANASSELERFKRDAFLYELFSDGIYSNTLQNGLQYKQIEEIQQRMNYFNEAHSQMQDGNIIYFYRNYDQAAYSVDVEKGTPIDVGVPRGKNGDPRDISSFQKFQTYIQVFLLARKLINEYTNKSVPKSQQAQVTEDFNNIFLETAACLGIAQTHQHAERLIKNQMKKLFQRYPGLTSFIEEKKDSIIDPHYQGLYLIEVLGDPNQIDTLNWLI